MRPMLCVTVVVALLVLPNLGASQGTGSLTGYALLRGGGSVPGVAVTVTAAGLRRTAVTGVGGEFTIEGLAPGVYRVQGDLAGFRTAVVENVTVAAGRTAEVNLQMRLGILGHVDYATPSGGMRRALMMADIVAHLRIVASLGAGLLGPDEILLATQHAATVLAVVKSPASIAAGDRIQFWQHMAGEWREGGRLIVGPEPVYSVGQEFVAFLKDDPQWGRGELMGPHLMFAVKNDTVAWVRQPTEGFRDGMNVSAFLAALRQLLTEGTAPHGRMPPNTALVCLERF